MTSSFWKAFLHAGNIVDFQWSDPVHNPSNYPCALAARVVQMASNANWKDELGCKEDVMALYKDLKANGKLYLDGDEAG